MPTTYKVLGQQSPAVTTNVDLYTVPAGKSAVVSTIAVNNYSAAACLFRIYVRVAAAAATTTNSIAYDITAAANTLTTLTIGLTLAATDVITVQSGTASSISFQAFGSEIA